MAYVNNYQCCGNLVASPLLQDHNGTPYAKFTVALNKPGAKRPVYVDCIAWGRVGSQIGDHCSKGSEVYVSGEVETDNFTDSRGSRHRSTYLKVEKFSCSPNTRSADVGNVRKPRPPGVAE